MHFFLNSYKFLTFGIPFAFRFVLFLITHNRSFVPASQPKMPLETGVDPLGLQLAIEDASGYFPSPPPPFFLFLFLFLLFI